MAKLCVFREQTKQSFYAPLKQYLGEQKCHTDDKVSPEVPQWFRNQPKEFNAARIQKLIKYLYQG